MLAEDWRCCCCVSRVAGAAVEAHCRSEEAARRLMLLSDGHDTYSVSSHGDGGVEIFIPWNRASYTLDEFMANLSQEQFPDGGWCGPPPASRSVVDAMPTVKIAEKHLCIESHCAVYIDEFEIGGEAREMPSKHIYHADCILPWLAQHKAAVLDSVPGHSHFM